MITGQTKFLLLFLPVAALILCSIGRADEPAKSPSETVTPPERIVISYPLGESPGARIGQKYFTHGSHAGEYKVACTQCHHVFEDGKNIWNEGMPTQKCSECHDGPVSESRKDLVPGFLLKNALDLPDCARCHRAGKGD